MQRLAAAVIWAAACGVAAELPRATVAKIDEIAVKSLAESGAPSVSIALVEGGKIAYENAYGKARLDPPVDAKAEMRYPIGSVSKQFLAGAMVLLVQDGKLSLDDTVSKYLPDLTRASEITIRQLLSHTSGYQDYYPQDYVAPFMQKPVTAESILDQWARKPLDFDPGTRWQYSNTNYVAAGRIVEKVTGGPFFAFLWRRILQPLGMTSAIDLSTQTPGPGDAAGYTRFALGPPRPATPEGKGWLYAAGELAMTAHDLALWDISLMAHKLLKPASLEAMTTPVRLRNGTVEHFDQVFIACHSDQALNLLSDPSRQETDILGAISYQANEALLHTDARLMPRRRLAWAAWNYHLPIEQYDRVTVTYNMNILQSLQAPAQFLLTLNRNADVDPAKVLGSYVYHHPVYTAAAVAAQKRRRELNGSRRTYYCGAYWSYGFHEDGVKSALASLDDFRRDQAHEQPHLQRVG